MAVSAASSKIGVTLLTNLLTVALLSQPPAQAGIDRDAISVGIPFEVDLVGLAFGVHPELLWRPINADGGFNLRAAAGVMAGPEFTLISPLALGVRQEIGPSWRVQPGLGMGVQWQSFAVYTDKVHHRMDMYMEATVHVKVHESYDVGLQLSPEFGMMGVGPDGVYSTFGLGMAVRLNVQRNGL